MPYHIRQQKSGRKLFEIIRDSDNNVVGTSDSKKKAEASIRFRMGNEEGKNSQKNSSPIRFKKKVK